MQRGNAIGAVRSDDGQMRHANLPRRALLDEAGARYASFVPREPGPDFVKEAPVDFVDNFELPRQEAFELLHRPLLERLGQ